MRSRTFLNRKINLFTQFCLFGFALIFSSCEDTTTPQNPTTEPTEIVKKNDTSSSDKNEIFLLNARATSAAKGSENWALFDNNENTIWISKPGTGQGEFIEINFIPTTDNYVEKINIQTQAGGKINRILKITLDVNGEYFGVFSPNTDILLKKSLKRLKIYFSFVDGLSEEMKKNNGTNRVMQHSPEGKAVGVTDVRLFGKNDALFTIRNIQNYNGNIATNSTLEPDNLYSSTHLFDGNTGLAWVEGADGNGVGESLNFNLVGEAAASKLIFYNGYQRSQEHFELNTRVRTFTIKTENQKAQKFTLRDDMTAQVLTFDPPLSGKNYELKIIEVYEGEKYKDLAISELVFLRADNQSWRVNTSAPTSGFEEQFETTIGNVIDRFISCTTEMDEQIMTQQIILRSDGTFDFNSDEDASIDDSRVWNATGTWKKISANTIKLNGGLSVRGDSKTSSFSEKITIKPTYIQGEEYFDKIYLK